MGHGMSSHDHYVVQSNTAPCALGNCVDNNMHVDMCVDKGHLGGNGNACHVGGNVATQNMEQWMVHQVMKPEGVTKCMVVTNAGQNTCWVAWNQSSSVAMGRKNDETRGKKKKGAQ